MMTFKLTNSLEKCFWDETATSKPELKKFTMLRNERYSFQICYNEELEIVDAHKCFSFRIESPLKDFIKLYLVKNIPSEMPVYRKNYDENYLRTTPGLYPDLLEPVTENYRFKTTNCLNSIWVEVDPQGKFPAGKYSIDFIVPTSPDTSRTVSVEVEIIDAELPPQELIFTQWFYADCLEDYYETGKYDERHWQIIENFMANAAKYGQNMILTPVLSPELDTAYGLYRTETQLVDVTVTKEGYKFNFDRLGRWVDLCDKVGIKYLEINHFFSQWGAAFCPQVWATVDGEYKRIFGWENSSLDESYAEFLRALIPALLSYLKNEKNGADRRCYFHISDEPNLGSLEKYTKVRNIIKPLVEGCHMMDALSEYEFYELGLIDTPVPSNNSIAPFIEHNVPNLWTYYCCGQTQKVSNRFFAMPSARNRIIGLQFYKFNIAGFLQWGYNFYNTQLSFDRLNPFTCSDGGCFAPSGDPYSVYPGPHGMPQPSLREVVFFDGLQDLRALKLLESLIGREKVLAIMEEGIPPITFDEYPHSAEYLLNLREKINCAIKEAL